MCSPKDYYSDEVQNFIERNRTDLRNRWIFNIVDGRIPATEMVLKTCPQWTLCRQVHGPDGKWLVVLHDETLQSLRDLRGKHINLLTSMQEDVKMALKQHYGNKAVSKFMFFMHYLPSTFQAHIHVHCPQILHPNTMDTQLAFPKTSSNRRQNLTCILRNLEKDNLHYSKCLFLVNKCGWMKFSPPPEGWSGTTLQ